MPPSLPRSSSTPLEVGHNFRAAGVSVIKVRADGTKAASGSWLEFKGRIATIEECQDWWGNGHPYGVAAICGEISGNLEMLEVEGVVATDPVFMDRLYDALILHDVHGTWNILNRGFMQMSPTGGLHLVYRLDCPPPGNEKVARRPATAQELLERPGNKFRVLIETRGEGGYFILAGSPLSTHATGQPWTVISGGPDTIPVITWAEREALHAALRTLDEIPVPAPAPQLPATNPSKIITSREGLSPGDDFEDRTDWADILEGWTCVHQTPSGGREWVRPGKDPREGISATTGRAADRDRLFVFSTSTEFQSETPYTKFGAYTLLNFGGDHSAAARELVRLGYGDRTLAPVTVDTAPAVAPDPTTDVAVVQPSTPKKFFRYDDDGNAMRLRAEVGNTSRFVKEFKDYVRWDGIRWVEDYDGATLHQAFMRIKEQMFLEADQNDDEALKKWAARCGMEGRRNAAISTFKKLPGMIVGTGDFDVRSDLLNVGNGVLNPRTRELVPHDPKYLMTRVFGTGYDPQATCPTWDSYMATVLPDEDMRRYVQRAIGYSLLGEPNRRSIFFVHGPGGTGKSTFMEVMQGLFGDYGATAAPGTFRAKHGEGPTNDLHGLRGKRFVSTSETTDNTSFEEDLLKRLAGNDAITSRDLYEKNQTWKPECVLWLATNHPPKFNSDDDAIWQRTKLIPFLTKLTGTAGEDPKMTEKLLAEVAGVFNWALAGLADFEANGLGEPTQVMEAASEQRSQSDPVQRFLEDRTESGAMVVDPAQRIRCSELHQAYVVWARECGERALTFRRFNHRLADDQRISQLKTGGYMIWVGVGRALGAGILGTM